MGNAADAGLLPVNTNSSLANNYASTTLRTQDSSTADGRIDFRFDNTQSVFVRYSFNNVDTFTPSACDATPEGIQPGCGGGPAFPGENNTKAHGTQVNYVRIFSPTMIAEVKGGYLKSQHSVAAPELRIEPELRVRHSWRQFRRRHIGPGADDVDWLLSPRRLDVHSADSNR
jgi:hypothetical protein